MLYLIPNQSNTCLKWKKTYLPHWSYFSSHSLYY